VLGRLDFGPCEDSAFVSNSQGKDPKRHNTMLEITHLWTQQGAFALLDFGPGLLVLLTSATAAVCS
jgi:hypothetical protein